MFIVLSNKQSNKNPNGEGTSKDKLVDAPAPSFTDMREMPNEHASLLQEQFWGGVNKTNFVIFKIIVKLHLYFLI
jgi:hypothetical protein